MTFVNVTQTSAKNCEQEPHFGFLIRRSRTAGHAVSSAYSTSTQVSPTYRCAERVSRLFKSQTLALQTSLGLSQVDYGVFEFAIPFPVLFRSTTSSLRSRATIFLILINENQVSDTVYCIFSEWIVTFEQATE